MKTQRVRVAEGVALQVHRWSGAGTPFLLVHGLASNLHMWDGVAESLAARGHPVVAVDLRGHGRSDKPERGYDLATVAGDLSELVARLGLDQPVAAGQSWGANVVLELAWRWPALVRGVAAIDGGWIELRRRFPDWDECARVMAPPAIDGITAGTVEARLRDRHPDWPESGIAGALACYEPSANGTVRPWLALEHHLAILRDLWEHPASSHYGDIKVPVLLVPAASHGPRTWAWAEERRTLVEEAEAALPDCEVVWMPGDHDLHAQNPELLAELLARATVDGSLSP